MEKSKEDHSTIHELSIELHSAKLAESTMIRRIQVLINIINKLL